MAIDFPVKIPMSYKISPRRSAPALRHFAFNEFQPLLFETLLIKSSVEVGTGKQERFLPYG